ncbi:MAG: 2-phospho-L-lactate guanylyltransferase [Chloroflexi bacterium]|nr:2-phospho-L-lactate guanylyltransferase [Chloroflexota bacterium]
MSVWAIVPIKPLSKAKSRLADVLTPEQRERLATELLLRTVRLLLPLTSIQGVLVISRDTKALAMVRELGAQTVQESGPPELNKALLRATQVLRTRGSESVLVVPSDMPLLSGQDIDNVVELGRYQKSVVIAPDWHEQGTNLLLVRPPGLIPYHFGENSFTEHQRLVKEADAGLLIYRSERVSLDLDTASDLRWYHQLAQVLDEPVIQYGQREELLLVDDPQPGG